MDLNQSKSQIYKNKNKDKKELYLGYRKQNNTKLKLYL